MLKKIYQELVLIRKELQVIRSSLESKDVASFSAEAIRETMLDMPRTLAQVTPDSLARQLQPEQNGE